MIYRLLFLALLPLLSAAEPPPVPLMVQPPTSQGTDQGFSREPTTQYFAEQSIVVCEYITPTIAKSPKGNNRTFHIISYYVDPNGKAMKRTEREVFEGTSRVANEMSFELTCTAPHTYREELGDGTYRIYRARFGADRRLTKLTCAYYDKSASPQTQLTNNIYGVQLLYPRPLPRR